MIKHETSDSNELQAPVLILTPADLNGGAFDCCGVLLPVTCLTAEHLVQRALASLGRAGVAIYTDGYNLKVLKARGHVSSGVAGTTVDSAASKEF